MRWIWLLAGLVACDTTTSNPSAAPQDAGPDQSVGDAAVPDAAVVDAANDAAETSLDGSLVDGALVDAAVDMLPDARPADAAPDACAPACGDRVCGPDGCGGTCGACAGLCEAGRCALPPNDVIISEFLASGEGPDWVELQNRGRVPVDLTGWSLTDDLTDRQKWTFDARVLQPGEVIVIPATGEGGPDALSFGLRAAGEALALVWRDGATIVDAFAPAFPPQRADISYGVTQAVEQIELLSAGDAVRWRIAEGPDDWTARAYDDSAWRLDPTGIGFSAGAGPVEGADLELLSAGRPTSQTSTLGGFGADRAVNGEPGDFTHTVRDDLEPEWRVDLEGRRWIERVVLTNRRSCCGSRLRDITVRVLDADDAVVWASPLLNPENALGTPARLEVEPGVEGRVVSVRRTPDPDLSGGAGNADEAAVLSLGEVEIFGLADPLGGRLATPIEPAAGLQMRARFDWADGDPVSRLALTVTTDAGFVVWLNGRQVAAVRAPEVVAWDSRAIEEADGIETVRLALPLDAVEAGENVLAIQALTADDSDLFLLPTLVAERVVDGPLRYFDAPTPGEYNTSPGFEGFVEPVRFDPPSGLVDGPVDVTLAADPPDAEIRYTLDGRNPQDGFVYEGPIRVARSTTMRAVAVREGLRPAPATAATWIVSGDVARQTADETLARGFPESWGNVVPDYGIDARVVDADPARFEAALAAAPTLAITAELDDLFAGDGIYTNSTRSGVDWERPAHVELFGAPEEPGFALNCGLRIQGGAFRNHNLTKKHSLRLLFKGVYGPTKLEYPLYDDPAATDRFDTITLRANSNDGWQWSGARERPLYIRDAFGRATRRAMGGVASRGRFAHVYLNGIYWGLYEMTERPDAAFASSYFGGDKDDWDAVNSGRVVDGDAMAWQMLLQLARAGLGEDAAYATYTDAWIDPTEYADYMLTNLYVGNTDWPHKNFYAARSRVAGTGFVAFMWDSEWSMGIRSALDTDRTGVSRGIAEPWAALRQNPAFRRLVGDRAHRHLFGDGALTPQRAIARFDALADQVALALVAESARWGDQHAQEPYTVDAHWDVERARVRAEYLPQRSGVFLEQLRRAGLYPDVDGPVFGRRSGPVEVGDLLAVEGEGALFYTLDGSDPRAADGAPTEGAREGPVEFEAPGPVEVRARFLVDGVWSALEVGRYTAQ